MRSSAGSILADTNIIWNSLWFVWRATNLGLKHLYIQFVVFCFQLSASALPTQTTSITNTHTGAKRRYSNTRIFMLTLIVVMQRIWRTFWTNIRKTDSLMISQHTHTTHKLDLVISWQQSWSILSLCVSVLLSHTLSITFFFFFFASLFA